MLTPPTPFSSAPNARHAINKAATTKTAAAAKPLRCGMVYFLPYDWLIGTP